MFSWNLLYTDTTIYIRSVANKKMFLKQAVYENRSPLSIFVVIKMMILQFTYNFCRSTDLLKYKTEAYGGITIK